MNYPKVLVISNNSFSKSGSNGRTLGSFFYGWPKERLAQFCLATNGPDFDVCDNYYCVTDKSALNAFLTLSIPQRTDFNDELFTSDKPISIKKNPKTPLRMLIRNIVWTVCRWDNKQFLSWIDDFSPEVVVVMNSDSYFPLNIARYLAKYRNVPLVVFNTEGFYLFKKNYMWKGELDTLFFPIYHHIYKHFFRKLMDEAKYAIYANGLLKSDYDAKFKVESSVIYTGSTVSYKFKERINEPPCFSYLGNFGFKRYETLVEISEILNEINPSYMLNVYGDAALDAIEVLKKAPYIVYKGLVSYEKVIEVMHQSDILFHVENQSEEFQESLKYGFSTKIADSIASGTLFCLYASPNIACSRYIQETQTALYSNSREELKEKIKHALIDNNYRKKIINRGYEIAKMNHNIMNNTEMFRAIIEEIAISQ